MTTEYKTIVRKIPKTITVEEKTPVVVHTLPDPDEPSAKDRLSEYQASDAQGLGDQLSHAFVWDDTAEGHAFWQDVRHRLTRLGQSAFLREKLAAGERK